MRKEDVFKGVLLIVIIILIATNINGINSFLTLKSDKAIEFGHSSTIVPDFWNTTKELNLTNESKNENASTNGYLIIDYWDDWPEDHISHISESKFKKMENGDYKVLKNDKTNLNGIDVSKQYFSNPSRDKNHIWSHIGINYVFTKEDTNYAIQVHYLTNQDYNNTTFMGEIEDRVENDICDIHNHDFNLITSSIFG